MCLSFRWFYLNTDRPLGKQETFCALSIHNCHPESILAQAKAQGRRSQGGERQTFPVLYQINAHRQDKVDLQFWGSESLSLAPTPPYRDLVTTEIEKMFSGKLTVGPWNRTYALVEAMTHPHHTKRDEWLSSQRSTERKLVSLSTCTNVNRKESQG